MKLELTIMSIENPTLVHFRHFSPLYTNLHSTSVESTRQIRLFLQNKPNVKYVQMSVSSFLTSICEVFQAQAAKKNNLSPREANLFVMRTP